MSIYVEEKIKRLQANLNSDLNDKINEVINKVNTQDGRIEELSTRVTECESIGGKTIEMIEDIGRRVAPMANIEKMVNSLCAKQGINPASQ
jgi:chromosome segregation ATPase